MSKQLKGLVKGGFQHSRLTTKLVTDLNALNQLIDPVCLKVSKCTTSGVDFVISTVCTNERPTYIFYSRSTYKLSMKFWIIRKGVTGLPTLVVWVKYGKQGPKRPFFWPFLAGNITPFVHSFTFRLKNLQGNTSSYGRSDVIKTFT